MARYRQINGGNGSGCGPASLMVAEHERSGGAAAPLTNAEEIVVHTQCGIRNHGTPAVYNANNYSSPVRLAHYATNTYGFAHASIVLSGQIFRRMLTARYPNELPLATTLGIPVETWHSGWSPRYLNSGRHWILMVVLCVDHTSMLVPRLAGGAMGGWLAHRNSGGSSDSRALVAGGAAAGALALGTATSLYDLARGLGLTGGPGNLSLHTVLYRGITYMDPATGQDYWLFGRMGGSSRAYWDAGCYILLS